MANNTNRAATREEVEALVEQYPGLRETLDRETGPEVPLTSCTTANAEGLECGKPISFVVNLSRLRDHGLTKNGAFPLRPADAKQTLSGMVASRAPHVCLANPQYGENRSA